MHAKPYNVDKAYQCPGPCESLPTGEGGPDPPDLRMAAFFKNIAVVVPDKLGKLKGLDLSR